MSLFPAATSPTCMVVMTTVSGGLYVCAEYHG